MVATASLLNFITETPTDNDDRLSANDRTRIVNELIAATLDERTHIEVVDTFGPHNKSRRFLTRPNGQVFRKMLEDWLAHADGIFTRLRPMHEAGQAFARFDELKTAVATTRCLLRFTIERIEKGMEEIRKGNCVTLEEGRRELHAQRGQ
jgi:hypothetical protein